MKFTFWLIGGIVFGGMLAILPANYFLFAKSFTWRVLAASSGEGVALARQSRSLIDIIRSIRNLHSENEALKSENLRLQSELDRLTEVDHENSVLRQELGFAQENRASGELVPAEIIGRSPSTFLQFVIIGKGSEAGVALKQAVISQGFLIGQIVEVTATTAKVELITASRSLVPIILSESRATGLLKGGLAGLTGEELPAASGIKPGEGVVSSGLGEIVPQGIPIGTVKDILSGESDIVERISVHSPIEFGKLEMIFVLK